MSGLEARPRFTKNNSPQELSAVRRQAKRALERPRGRKSHGRHQTARVHHGARRCSSGVAARGAGTAGAIRRAEDIAPLLEALKGRADALYVASDPLLNTNRIRINTLALGARLPTMHGVRDYVEAGGLMSYGTNIVNQYRRAADYTDKILRGAKPGPVEQPTKFDLVINLTTAKALGLTVSDKLLSLADEVIE